MQHAHLAGIPLLCTLAAAQTTFNEVEPNSTKSEATQSFICMESGDQLAGTCTGADPTPGSSALASVDTFRIKTCPRTPGIYSYLLYDIPQGYSATLRSLNQTGTPGSGGTPGTLDIAHQTTQFITADYVVWYGFGKGDEVYVRVQRNSGAATAYTLTLGVVAQFIRWIDGTFAPGPITISTVGLTALDTDLVLLDGNFDFVPGGTNDDEFPVASKQSRLMRTLAPGVYYLGVTLADIATPFPAPADEGFPTGHLLDFPGAIAGSSTSQAGFTFTISDGTRTVFDGTDQPFAFTVRWFRFTVGEYPVTPFCFGDGTSIDCQCGAGAVGHGCPNSADPAGGLVTSTGTPSLGADDLTLLTTNLPPSSTALFFQSDDYFWGTVGDGIICASGGTIIRLGVTTSVGGNSQLPAGGGQPISVVGQIPGSPATRYYQVAYRDPPTFCTTGTFNYTNALRAVWGP